MKSKRILFFLCIFIFTKALTTACASGLYVHVVSDEKQPVIIDGKHIPIELLVKTLVDIKATQGRIVVIVSADVTISQLRKITQELDKLELKQVYHLVEKSGEDGKQKYKRLHLIVEESEPEKWDANQLPNKK